MVGERVVLSVVIGMEASGGRCDGCVGRCGRNGHK